MNWDAFKAVVQEGELVGGGMPKFAELRENELRALYMMYIRRRARAAAQAAP